MIRHLHPRRIVVGSVTLGLGILFLGDLVTPGPESAPLAARPPLPLVELIKDLPARNVGRGGKPGDPLNLIFLGTESEVRGALTAAGWTNIPVRIPTSFRAGLKELLQGKMFRATPPMNLYRIEGRVQDLNWSMPITPIAKRHHFRLWQTSWRDEKGRAVWWGSGNYDLSVRWHDLSHRPDPDNDAERDFIGKTLAGSPWVASARHEPAPQIPREGANDKGYPFRTDGRALVFTLKTPEK